VFTKSYAGVIVVKLFIYNLIAYEIFIQYSNSSVIIYYWKIKIK